MWTPERLQLLERCAVSLQVLLDAAPVEKGTQYKEPKTKPAGTDSEKQQQQQNIS